LTLLLLLVHGSNDVDDASQLDEIAADRERHLFIISTDPCMAATKFVLQSLL